MLDLHAPSTGVEQAHTAADNDLQLAQGCFDISTKGFLQIKR